MHPPALSVVVISYNMARELPRTVGTLAPSYQRDIDAVDYEVIVVDNGSTEPWSAAALTALGPNIQVHRFPGEPSVSPAAAVNFGLQKARGDLVGVCIDGARMASPRILATALDARRLHERPVIGTLAYHLGPDVQSRSMTRGYDQQAEDGLLASVGWENDGYRLFEISTVASSSARGWFTIPAESNAIFLTRQNWRDLGGYDVRFNSPGGGLVNLDTWARACADPDGEIILLLGEATFHQVHGGVSTNAAVSMWRVFHDEYVAIRGHDYETPRGCPLIVGRVTNDHVLANARPPESANK